MKAKTPPWPSQHTQPRLFDTTVSACLCTRELISTLLLLGGGVCPCTLTEKNKHTICLQTWGSKSASALRRRWKVESKGLFSQHAADVRLYLPLQTAPGFISRGRWQMDRGRAHVLGGVDANIWRWHAPSFPFLPFFLFVVKTSTGRPLFNEISTIRNISTQISVSDLFTKEIFRAIHKKQRASTELLHNNNNNIPRKTVPFCLTVEFLVHSPVVDFFQTDIFYSGC